MTAISTEGIIEIVKAHGLIPIALDIDWQTLCPTKQEIISKTTSKTRAVIFNYIYGK